VAQLFLLLLGRVWVVGMAVKPCLEEVGRLFWKLAALALGAVDEGRGRRALGGAVGRVEGGGGRHRILLDTTRTRREWII
jgi:hypothetical protein